MGEPLLSLMKLVQLKIAYLSSWIVTVVTDPHSFWPERTVVKDPDYHKLLLPYSTYYKPMMYYKPTPSSAQSSYIGIGRLYMVYSYISSVCIISPPPVRSWCKEITHGLIIRTIRYSNSSTCILKNKTIDKQQYLFNLKLFQFLNQYKTVEIHVLGLLNLLC